MCSKRTWNSSLNKKPWKLDKSPDLIDLRYFHVIAAKIVTCVFCVFRSVAMGSTGLATARLAWTFIFGQASKALRAIWVWTLQGQTCQLQWQLNKSITICHKHRQWAMQFLCNAMGVMSHVVLLHRHAWDAVSVDVQPSRRVLACIDTVSKI